MDLPPLLLTEAELIDASGGYRKPSAQLRELLKRGFFRSYRSPLTGRVILERAHYLAVAGGQVDGTLLANAAPSWGRAQSEPRAPKLRLQR